MKPSIISIFEDSTSNLEVSICDNCYNPGDDCECYGESCDCDRTPDPCDCDRAS